MHDEYTIEIERHADDVWAILSDGFADVGRWATAIPASRPAENGEGRYCATPFRGFGEVKEVLTAHDEDARTYTYAASGVPRWMGKPRNTWFVESLGDRRCVAGFRPELDTTVLGSVAFRLSGFRTEQLARQILSDLKHFAETGEVSPEKRASMPG